MAVVSIYRGLLTCEWGQSRSRRGTTERTRPQPMSAHSLCLQTAPVCAPSNWMFFNHTVCCFSFSSLSHFTVGNRVHHSNARPHFADAEYDAVLTEIFNKMQHHFFSLRSYCEENSCTLNTNACVIEPVHSLVYFRMRVFCACFSVPLYTQSFLLCRGLSRFSLFGGCNAMPPVGSCSCWRPLGPN